jgi:hypothetical protein
MQKPSAEATTHAEAEQALAQLDRWVMSRCVGGPWKALEPLGVLRQYLRQGSSHPSRPEISPPAADTAPAA